ncbi:hypothetical protein Tco_0545224 [Tanacetum coccineum]
MSRLCGEITQVCQDRIAFVRELESVAGVTVTAKTAMFLKEMMDKEGSREWQLVDLEKEAKERALEIDWSMGEDYRLASEINRVAGEVNNMVVVKDQFLEELDSLGVRPVPTKMAEFLRERQMKDKETVAKLQILEREMEMNAQRIYSFRSLKELFHIEDVGVVAWMF